MAHGLGRLILGCGCYSDCGAVLLPHKPLCDTINSSVIFISIVSGWATAFGAVRNFASLVVRNARSDSPLVVAPATAFDRNQSRERLQRGADLAVGTRLRDQRIQRAQLDVSNAACVLRQAALQSLTKTKPCDGRNWRHGEPNSPVPSALAGGDACTCQTCCGAQTHAHSAGMTGCFTTSASLWRSQNLRNR